MTKGKGRLTGEERRRQIVEKASEVFAVHGLDGTRTRDLARECGINESLLYKHFDSKEHLYRESMAFLCNRMSNSWRSLANENLDGIGAIKETLETACAFFSENPQIAANMLHGIAASTHAPEMQKQASEWFLSYHRFLQGLLETGVKEGKLKPDLDIASATMSLMGVAWVCAISQVLDLDEWHQSMSPGRMITFLLGDSLTKPEP